MKKLKYLALLGLAGDLLLSPLGLAVAVFGSQYRGGIAEEVYEAMDVEEYEPLMADERLYDVFEEDGLEISEEEYLYEGRDVEAEDADAGDSDELVFLTREEALLLSDEEIRELGGEVMEAERISPFARHFGDENVPWRELAAYNACPNRNGDGSFILNAIIVDSPNAEGTNVAATQCVNTAAALNAAWNHNAVRRIIMMADITLAASDAITRNTSLEFDGNGRRPDGRPSGNGAGGDGFTLTQPALTHTLNLGAAAGAGGAEVGLGLTAVTNDTVNIPFQDGGGALLHFHSVVVASPSTAGLTGNPAGAAFINSTVPWYYSNNPAAPARRNRTGTWRFRFGNVRSNGVAIEGRDAISGRVTDWSIPQTSGQAGIQRFLRAPQAEVTFYGDVLLNTRGQNAYVGKVLVEDDALLVGNMSAGYNDFYGNIWFNVRMHGETTGSDPSCGRLTVPEGTDCRNSVVLGRGARAIFTSTTALSHAPAVHGHWRNLVIGEQATFETSQNAPAIAFNSNIANTGGIESVRNATQTVRVHSGGRLVATRRDVGPVIHNVGPNVTNAGGLVASNALIDIRPGGELYVLGNTTAALINLTGINNRLQVEAGALVDLRNENAAGTSRLFERGGNYRFENMGEAILWTTSGGNAMNTRPATHSFSHVADLAITGTAAAGIVSSDPGLQSTLRGTANFRRLVTTTQSPTISHIEPVTEGDTTISGRVIWPDIPVSLGVGNGIIGRGIPMGPLVGSFGRSILLNDTFHPAWVRQYSYAEGYEHEEPERYLSGLVPGNALTVPLDEDGSFTHATQPQEAGAYIMARLNDGDDGVSTWVSFPEDGIGEGMVFDPDYDTYDEDGQGLMFITSAESRSWTDQQVREAGGGVSRPAPAINPQSLARNTVPWRDLAPHNACPNINGDGSFIWNLAVLQDDNDPASGVICVGNDGEFPGTSALAAIHNGYRAAGHMQAAWNNNNIRRIILMSDVTFQVGSIGEWTSTAGGRPALTTFPANSYGGLATRNTDLEFDGNGRRPDGRPSGNGQLGDGFRLIQHNLANTFNLAPATGAAGGTGAGIATPADAANFEFGNIHFHSVVLYGTAFFGVGGGTGGSGVINSSVYWAGGSWQGGTAATPTRVNRSGTWRYRFGNIRTNQFQNVVHDPMTGRVTDWTVPTSTNLQSITRLTRGQQAEMTFYGDVLLNTRAENVYTGKLLFEDDALYVGNVNTSDFSILWFSARMHGQTSGSSPSCGNPQQMTLPAGDDTDCRNSMILGRGARVFLTSTSGASHYPAVYGHWRNIIVGEGAAFEVSSNTPSIAFSSGTGNTGGAEALRRARQMVRVHDGGRLMATRQNNGAVIHNQSPDINTSGAGAIQNARIDIRPGAQFFVMGSAVGDGGQGAGNNAQSIINLTNGSAANPNILQVDGAATVDIRNEHTSNTARIFDRGVGAHYEFYGINEFVLWTNGTTGPGSGASFTTGGTHQINYREPSFIIPSLRAHEDNLVISGTGEAGIVSTIPGLQSTLRNPGSVLNNTAAGAPFANTGRFRRLVATAHLPYARLTDAVTDADHTIRGEVVLTHVPYSTGFGNAVVGSGIAFRPLLAGSARHRILINDSFHTDIDAPIELVPQENGSFEYTDPENRLQQAGSTIALRAVRLDGEGGINYTQSIEERSSTTVLDVTPPTPATMDSQDISTVTPRLSGRAPNGAEGAIIEVNGIHRWSSAIDEEGRWSVDIPEGSLRDGDTVQILLFDGAALSESDFDFSQPTAGIPETFREDFGNLNPRAGALSHRNASFAPGPTATVREFTPVGPRDPDTFEEVIPLVPDPDNPGEFIPWEPAPAGFLSIDFASAFRFRDIAIGSGRMVAHALPQPLHPDGHTDLWVQVTDQRNVATGWDLHVEMDSPFTNGNHTLTGARVLISRGRQRRAYPVGQETPIGEISLRHIALGEGEGLQRVLSVIGDERLGTHLATFAPEDVIFDLPDNTAVMAGDYQASFRWLLSNTPSNVNP